MKKTLITLLALAGTVFGADSLPGVYGTWNGSDTITLSDFSASNGVTVAAKLNVSLLQGYMAKNASLSKHTLIEVTCDRGNDPDARIGVQTNYTSYDHDSNGDTASVISSSGLYGTWNGASAYSFGMGSGFQDSSFWENVTGASVVLTSQLVDGVATGTGTTENAGTTAVFVLEKNVGGKVSYVSYGGTWYDGLWSRTITTVESITFDSAVLGAIVYNEAVTSDVAKLIGQKAISAIPEPATATLSLLALCGLCARRRRK